MLLIAIQWGGTEYPWRSAHVIGLFCGAGVVLLIFAAWEWHEQDQASIPPKILGQRSVFFGAVIGFLSSGSLQLVTYFIPIWFQVIKGASPTRSGVMNLPSILGTVVLAIVASGLGVYRTNVLPEQGYAANERQSLNSGTTTLGSSSERRSLL